MKKLLFSLLAVGVTSALAIGATRAYFTDTESVLGNTISTGTIDISNTAQHYTTDDGHGHYSWSGISIALNNAKPGDTIRQWVKITNTGSLSVGSLKVSAVNAQGDTYLLDSVRVSLYGTVDTYGQGIYSPDWGNGQIVSSWLQNVNILGTAVYNDASAGHVLLPGASDVIILDFKIPTTWDNTYQGKSVTFDVQFDGEQVH